MTEPEFRSIRRRLEHQVVAPLRAEVAGLQQDLMVARAEMATLKRDAERRKEATEILKGALEEMHRFCAVCYGARSYFPRYGDRYAEICTGRVHDLIVRALASAEEKLT